MILVIDNYDSFTYNLVQYLGMNTADIQVYRNDKITVETIRQLNPSAIVISPGPGYPSEAGLSMSIINSFYQTVPMLGICLGMQAMAEVFGADVIPAPQLVHGKDSPIDHDNSLLFADIENPFMGGRYHSLIVDKKSLPSDLVISAQTEDKELMGIRHSKYPVYGLQFHPESILTKGGFQIIKNFVSSL